MQSLIWGIRKREVKLMNYIKSIASLTCFNVSVFTYTLNAIYTENKIIAIANEIFNDCIILEKSTAAFN